MRYLAMCLFVFAFAAPLAQADPTSSAPTVSNMSVREFVKFHDDLAGKLQRKEYNRVSDRDRSKIAEAQTQIHRMLDGKTSMEQLSEIDRVALFNAHERVVAAWDDAEEQRLICRRVSKIGSHRPETVCTTVAQQREERTDVRREHMRVRTCAQNCGSGG